MKTLLTVILNWRTADMTLQSAEAALREVQGIPGALTIVDNDSGDGSYERLVAAVTARGWDKGETPVRVIQAGRNAFAFGSCGITKRSGHMMCGALRSSTSRPCRALRTRLNS